MLLSLPKIRSSNIVPNPPTVFLTKSFKKNSGNSWKETVWRCKIKVKMRRAEHAILFINKSFRVHSFTLKGIPLDMKVGRIAFRLGNQSYFHKIL